MEQGLFRTELEAILDRYGYLMWRQCRATVEPPELADRVFNLAVHRVARTGAELRGREHKLGWLFDVIEEVSRGESPNRARAADSMPDLMLQAWHAGDPDPDARRRSESPDAKELLDTLGQARTDFPEQIDVEALLSEVFIDEPLPPRASSRRQLVSSIAAVVGFFVVATVLWPRQEDMGVVPKAFALVVIVDRGGEVLRESGPKLMLTGGEELQLELSIPKAQTVSVYALEDDGDLTPLAIGRLFRPGIHRLPQTLHIDPQKPLSARLVAGAPALVRTATSTGRFDEVSVIQLISRH